MPRYRLTIAYDGTDFVGWQKQSAGTGLGGAEISSSADPTVEPRTPEKPASPLSPPSELRTVQGVVERTVREAVRQPIILIGASRTDSGVHARFQTAAFTTQEITTIDGRRIGPPDERLMEAINSRLPPDILVTACVPADPLFDPIKDCLCKGYRYSVWSSFQRLWDRARLWHQRGPLDISAMDAAARPLEGTHDFAGFAAAGHGRESTVRTILMCRVHRGEGERVEIDVAADGFLWNMVRIIAGTLVEVGRGKIAPSDIPAILESKDRRRAGATAPAQGLCLMWACYPEDDLATLPEPVRARMETIEARRAKVLAARRERASRGIATGGDPP